MRVNVQLIDAETGNHLWAERFDKPLADLFDMQDEIVARLANALNAQLVAAEARRAEQAQPRTRWTCIFKAWLGSIKVWPLRTSRRRVAFLIALCPPTRQCRRARWFGERGRTRRRKSFAPMSAFAAAEAKLGKALSSVPDHARGHCG